jgi:small-conductance mechanosensitive channel
MEFWHRLQHLELGWTGLGFMVLCWIGVLFLRRLLPDSRRRRGRFSSYALGVAPLVHLVATGFALVGLDTVAAALHLCNLALVTTAAAGVAGMVLFDIVLARTRFAVPDLMRDLTQVAIMALIAMVVLQSAGLTPLSIAATSTVATAVLGLAMQNALANVGAGVLFQVDQSIRLGDWIQVGHRAGRVEAFTWRATAIRTPSGDLAYVPNAQLLGAEVLNCSKPARAHRVSTRVSFHHRHPPGEVAALVTETLCDVPGVLADPPPSCTAMEFGGSNVTYNAEYWIDDMDRESAIHGAVLTRLWYATSRSEMDGPCPAPGATRTEAELAAARAVLASSKLFVSLSEERREVLASAMRPRRYADGERVLREGDAGSSMFLVAHGAVRLARVGDDATPDFFAGDHFGEMSLLTGAPRTATCRASGECLCYEVDGAAFRAVVAADPSLAEAITEIVAARMRESEEVKERASRPLGEQQKALWLKVKRYFRL